jgi:hypothetical protein
MSFQLATTISDEKPIIAVKDFVTRYNHWWSGLGIHNGRKTGHVDVITMKAKT